MTETHPETRTRPTDQIEPIVPLLPRDPYCPDGGPRSGWTRERPPATDYADPSTRDREELEPMVPHLG